MDGYLVERTAILRHAELAALAEAGEVARRYRRDRRAQAVAAGEAVRAWRVAVGRRLVAAGLRLGVPARHRPAARRDARVLLGDEVSPLDTAGSLGVSRPAPWGGPPRSPPGPPGRR